MDRSVRKQEFIPRVQEREGGRDRSWGILLSSANLVKLSILFA